MKSQCLVSSRFLQDLPIPGVFVGQGGMGPMGIPATGLCPWKEASVVFGA